MPCQPSGQPSTATSEFEDVQTGGRQAKVCHLSPEALFRLATGGCPGLRCPIGIGKITEAHKAHHPEGWMEWRQLSGGVPSLVPSLVPSPLVCSLGESAFDAGHAVAFQNMN